MRTSVIPIFLLAICIPISAGFCLAQQPTPSPTSGNPKDQLCTVSGTVLSANTGEPLKKAHVVLYQGAEGDHPNAEPLTTTTDPAGHFSIDKIPAGSYELVVNRTNYLPSHYGQDRFDKPGATLSLAAGQKMMDLLFRLHRMAVITGRVLDEDGEPLREVSVVALVHTTVRGKPKIEPSGGGTTNDLGEYRIIDLTPGRYSILANLEAAHTDPEYSQRTQGYIPTYYPGTSESSRASTLEVKSGDEISSIDFVLAPKSAIRTFVVRGHVLNSIPVDTETSVFVMVFPRRNREAPFAVNERKQVQADKRTGEFEIQGLIPGEYIAAAFAAGDGKFYTATQNVDVSGSDIDGVSLVVTKGIDIPGRISFEGASAASAADVGVSLVLAEDESIWSFGGGQASVKADRSFVLKGVSDGTYSLNVSSKCRECYLKSAKANGIDLLEQGVQVASGAGPASIAIVYSSNSATLTGAVTNKDDLPAPGATVVLIPEAGSHQKPEQFKTSTTDQYGHFEIRGVPPGHYKAFAWEKIDAESYGDPVFLKPVENMAESFDIASNEQKSVQLKMIPATDSAN